MPDFFHILLFLAAATATSRLAAQDIPELDLRGTVTGPNGAALKDAKVSLPGRGLEVRTDRFGNYTFKSGTTGMRLRSLAGGAVQASGAFFALDGRFLKDAYGAATPHFRAPRIAETNASAPDVSAPLRKPSASPVTASSPAFAAAAPETLSVVAIGFERGERALLSLTGTQDFKLNALRYTDVPYKTGTISDAEKAACLLDVHKPATGSKWPVIVHFHGGGMVEGDKTEGWTSYHNNFAYKFLDAGYMMVMPNYRLIGKGGTWPGYIRDAAAAAVWVRKNIEPYGGDPENVFISGWSAGAYLTQMLFLDTTWFGEARYDAHAFRGFISLSSQTRQHENIRNDLKVSDIMDQKPYAMPMGHVRKTDIPFQIFVGGLEGQTITDNQALYNGLIQAGSKDAAINVIANHAHNDMGNFMGNATDETRTRFLAFLAKYRKP
jgi:hypothetical protein